MKKDYTYTGYNHVLKERAVELRKNMTEAEKHLWYDHLKEHKVKFYRQRVINRYIADFYCSKAKLVIELDGKQHLTDTNLKLDEYRTKVLGYYGLKVLRFSNDDIIYRFEKVCKIIDDTVIERI